MTESRDIDFPTRVCRLDGVPVSVQGVLCRAPVYESLPIETLDEMLARFRAHEGSARIMQQDDPYLPPFTLYSK